MTVWAFKSPQKSALTRLHRSPNCLSVNSNSDTLSIRAISPLPVFAGFVFFGLKEISPFCSLSKIAHNSLRYPWPAGLEPALINCYNQNMATVRKTIKFILLLAAAGFLLDVVADSLDACQWCDSQNCAAVCHSENCLNHIVVPVTKSPEPNSVLEFSPILHNIRIPQDRIQKFFHPPK